jgi:hypothetical protein
MNPKEKAEQLFQEYLNVGMGNGWAKQCALILINEMLTTRDEQGSFVAKGIMITYWKCVKTEIEKL